jgi:hypothetical protein
MYVLLKPRVFMLFMVEVFYAREKHFSQALGKYLSNSQLGDLLILVSTYELRLP